MHRYLGAVAAAVVLAGMAGCSEKPPAPAEPNSLGLEKIKIPQTQPSAGVEPFVWLRTSFPPGQYVLHYRSNTIARSHLPPPFAVQKDKEHWWALSVPAPDATGNVTMQLRMTRVRFRRRGDKPLVLDTDDPASMEGTELGAVLKKMKKTMPRSALTVNRDCQFVRATGMDEVLEVIRSAGPSSASLPSQLASANRMVYDRCFPARWLLPEKPVGVGAIWQARGSHQLTGKTTLSRQARCRLSELAQTGQGLHATVEYVLSAEFTTDKPQLPRGWIPTTQTVDKLILRNSGETITGRLILNVDTGCLVEQAEWVSQDLHGEAKAEGEKPNAQVRRLIRTTVTATKPG